MKINVGQRFRTGYRSRLSDSTYSIYADTTQKFDKLLAFDAKVSEGGSLDRVADSNAAGEMNMKLIPLFKFTLMYPDSATVARNALYLIENGLFLNVFSVNRDFRSASLSFPYLSLYCLYNSRFSLANCDNS